MRREIRRWAFFLSCAALAAPAAAHDTWLLARSAAVQPGPIVLDLTSGLAFPVLDYPIKAERIERADVRLAGKTMKIGSRRAAAKSLRLFASLAEPGIASFSVELAPKPIDLKPDKVREYLEEIGAPEAIRRAREANPTQRWREIYTKHAKTYVRVGEAAGDRSWAEPVGMALEIVPEADPTALRVGDELPVRLLKHGKPLSGLPLGLVHEGNAKGSLLTTNIAGRVTFHLDRPGRWLLRATELRPAAEPGADWESDFTTVTLYVSPGSVSGLSQ